MVVWLIWLGYGFELVGVVLLASDLRDRWRRLRQFETTVTGVANGVLQPVEATMVGKVTGGTEETVEERLDRLEEQMTEIPEQRRRDIKAAEQRMSDAVEHRVTKAEQLLSARLGQLRDLVVGTTGVGRAAWALSLLVVGLFGQLAAALVALAAG